MSFNNVSADAYARFMGRYAEPLAGGFADLAGVRPGQRALDVGCGPGALTAQLIDRLGPDAVSAIDPSPPFITAVRERFPEVDIHSGTAEDLPFAAGSFDVALAQLVVHFMADPVQGLREMARVTRPGGTIAACVWDHAGGRGPLSPFWKAAHEVLPEVHDESDRAGARAGQLAELFAAAGVQDVQAGTLTVEVPYESFDEWWEPYTLGVGPAGAYTAKLSPEHREALRAHCAEVLPAGPFTISATAWTTTGTT
ncbi:class I SAM-dependent methyltransferase [Kribbella deserti]|uniref:Class I SAM-dependent methyltransferase n=1 Tax=Kribbella deserti TaxID=1926257 RepID=A0ABV6QR24_9ACTN